MCVLVRRVTTEKPADKDEQQRDVKPPEQLPDDAIPAEHGGFPPGGPESVMQMRWENRHLISQLWRGLANRVYSEYEDPSTGQPRAYLVRVGRKQDALLNDVGANEVINMLLGQINPVMALSNLQMEDARQIWANLMKKTARVLVTEEERYGCEEVSKKYVIMNIVEPLTFSQFMRAVEGHEAEAVAKQINDDRRDYHITDDRGNSWMPSFGSSKKKRREKGGMF